MENIKCHNKIYADIDLDFYDPGKWKNVSSNLRDLIVEKGPIRDIISNLGFPKDENSKHFFTIHYTRILANGEKYDRRWLVYSKELNKIFCFCCKLFSKSHLSSQLVNDGCSDWKNLSAKIKAHETTNEHITNMFSWIELEMRLQKNKTIDKRLQDQINKEKEHWRNVLLRIIAVVNVSVIP